MIRIELFKKESMLALVDEQDIHRAVVFTRGLWDKPPTSLVGNSQSTLAAAFSPIMYHKRSATATAVARSSKAKETRAVGASDGPSSSGSSSSRGSRPGVHHVVAIAGRDNVITIWLAAESRPVAILKEVFQQPPSDLAWAPDGYTLLISGHDGVVVVLRFSTQEIGLPLPEVGISHCFVLERFGGFGKWAGGG